MMQLKIMKKIQICIIILVSENACNLLQPGNVVFSFPLSLIHEAILVFLVESASLELSLATIIIAAVCHVISCITLY